MTDLAKVADLVLMVVDASYGFEMETFEYINMLQLHGFPKVMGVLTNCDKFRNMKSLQNAKKALKHRFWTEIYKGAKMFEFMGVVNNKYRKHEVKRLSLYVSRVKFRPLVWRNTHPFMVVDRVEDVTPHGDRENGEREVALFGYVRGTHFKSTMQVHLVGAGDFSIANMDALDDPCPVKKDSDKEKSLSAKKQKESSLYAPMANVGRVSMDKDSTYIELRHVNYSKRDQLFLSDQGQQPTEDSGRVTGPMQLLRDMQDVKTGVDEQLRSKSRHLDIFARKSGDPEEKEEEEEDEYDQDDDEDDEEEDLDDDEDDDENEEEEEEDDDDDAEDDDDEEEEEGEDESSEGDDEEKNDYNGGDDDEDVVALRSMAQLQKGNSRGSSRAASQSLLGDLTDMMKVVYGDSWLQTDGGAASGSSSRKGKFKTPDDDDDDDGEFFAVKKSVDKQDNLDWLDSTRTVRSTMVHSLGSDDDFQKRSPLMLSRQLMKMRFVTGGYKNPINADKSNDGSDGSAAEDDNEDDGSEVEGDFVDLEANPEALTLPLPMKSRSKTVANEDGSDEEDREADNDRIDAELRALNAQKKAQFKAKFDDKYDKKKTVSVHHWSLICMNLILLFD
jgi:ribosome biogenesis protein BMS1